MINMMDDSKKKGMVALILGKTKKEDSDKREESEPKGYDGEKLAGALIEAIKSGDKMQTYKAIKAIVSYCMNDND